MIALIGVAAGIIGWFRPVPHNEHQQAPTAPSYTDQQIANAKTDVCFAYKYAKNEVALNTHRPDFEGDPVGSLAAATMKRLSLYVAGDYLLERLTVEPANPRDLADAVRSLANSYEQAAIHTLSDEPNVALDPLRHAVDSHIAKIDGLCK
ncbi:hypothetical protein [uncultured Mycobacterium sp.]|uniref:hypothetical protein n=1 Tax=uncultured Mycobacterium sp. TaxID=171292 RepID=UPI0035CA995B